MTKIETPNFSLMKNDEYLEFCRTFDALLRDGLTAQIMNKLAYVASAINDYDQLLGKDIEIFANRIKSAHKSSESAWRSIKTIARTQSSNSDFVIASAAKEVLSVYTRNPTSNCKTYDSYHAVYKRGIDDFAVVIESLRALHVEDWFEALKKAVAVFQGLRQTKVQSKAEVPKGSRVKLRTALKAAIAKAVEYVNALNVMEDGMYDNLIEQLNCLIREKKAKLKASSNKAAAIAEAPAE